MKERGGRKRWREEESRERERERERERKRSVALCINHFSNKNFPQNYVGNTKGGLSDLGRKILQKY